MLWLISALCILGNILVIRKSRWGFALWMVCNVVLCWRNYEIGEGAQAALFGVYFGLEAWGFVTWEGSKIDLKAPVDAKSERDVSNRP
jgi:nicotinamide riboside transporter PnuC